MDEAALKTKILVQGSTKGKIPFLMSRPKYIF